jgi:hypothetical protein
MATAAALAAPLGSVRTRSKNSTLWYGYELNLKHCWVPEILASSFMKRKMKRHHSLLAVSLILVSLTSSARDRFPVSREVMDAPDTQIWGVRAKTSESGYQTHSVTRLKGADRVGGEPTSVAASGSTGNWQWEVRAVPSLLPSLKAWQSDKEVQAAASDPDNWSYPATSWEQGFARAYKVVSYLLGRPPLPMKLTLLLVPKGSAYEKVFDQTGNDFIPLTFAFHYPAAGSESDTLTAERFSAMVEAISQFVHEYQHTLVDTKAIEPTGKDQTDKTINSEIRSQCWTHSTALALASGTISYLKWNPTLPDELIERKKGHNLRENPQPKPRRFSDAYLWAGHLVAKNLSAYLLERGYAEAKVEYSDLAGMNAVLSFCAAITQHPRDLTLGSYPTSQVEFVPFFPSSLSSHKQGGGK